MPPKHPGETLREGYLKPLGLTANRLAIELQVAVTRVNDILRGKRAVTADSVRQDVPKQIHSMGTGFKRLPGRFYRSDSGREPVREWLKSLDAADRRVIGEDIKDGEFSWPFGMPAGSVPRPGYMGGPQQLAAWADRARSVLYRIRLHGAAARLHEETQRTPKQDIDLAIRRKRE